MTYALNAALVAVIVSLLLVGAVTHTPLRHAIQVATDVRDALR